MSETIEDAAILLVIIFAIIAVFVVASQHIDSSSLPELPLPVPATPVRFAA